MNVLVWIVLMCSCFSHTHMWKKFNEITGENTARDIILICKRTVRPAILHRLVTYVTVPFCIRTNISIKRCDEKYMDIKWDWAIRKVYLTEKNTDHKIQRTKQNKKQKTHWKSIFIIILWFLWTGYYVIRIYFYVSYNGERRLGHAPSTLRTTQRKVAFAQLWFWHIGHFCFIDFQWMMIIYVPDLVSEWSVGHIEWFMNWNLILFGIYLIRRQ